MHAVTTAEEVRIQDALWRCDLSWSDARGRLRQLKIVISELERRNGDPPTEVELAQALKITLADYRSLLQQAQAYQLVSCQASTSDHYAVVIRHATARHPQIDVLDKPRLRESLVAGINTLSKPEKMAIGLYFEQDLNIGEIGQVLGVSAARVRQTLTDAIARLREYLRAMA
jgi:RNA polymerase sigma factor for flagellar operon FliA